MKLQFNADQEYQKKAVRSTVGLFKGQDNEKQKTESLNKQDRIYWR